MISFLYLLKIFWTSSQPNHCIQEYNVIITMYIKLFKYQVLSIIFAVFTLVKSTAHKELIDLVMAVKECGSISNLENVSKTKVRGVIALLKLAAIIETHGGSTEKAPVNLTLSLTIDSYETLREQHDEFISNFGATQPVVWRDEVRTSTASSYNVTYITLLLCVVQCNVLHRIALCCSSVLSSWYK